MKTKAFLSYLYLSTALCTFTSSTWGMEEDEREKNLRFLSSQKKKHGKGNANVNFSPSSLKHPQDFFYEDHDISEYLEAFFQQNQTFSLLKDRKYLLSAKKEEFCPIKDQLDGKAYIVAVTDAVDTQNASVNIEYFLDKGSRKSHMKGEDEQEKILEELIAFKAKSKENSYSELLQKIEELKKNENRLESIHELLNKSEDNIESAQKAFQEKLLSLREAKKDVFDEIMPHLLNPQEAYAKILFPYNLTNSHWLTGEICISREKDNYDLKVYAHDPYGQGQMIGSNFSKIKTALQKRIKEHHSAAQFKLIDNPVSPYGRRQQSGDIISCGVITSEDLIKRITGQSIGDIGDTIDLKRAKELRKIHIEVVRKADPKASFIKRNENKVQRLNEEGNIPHEQKLFQTKAYQLDQLPSSKDIREDLLFQEDESNEDPLLLPKILSSEPVRDSRLTLPLIKEDKVSTSYPLLSSSVLPPLMALGLEELNKKIIEVMGARLDVYEQARKQLITYEKILNSPQGSEKLSPFLLSPEVILEHQKHDLELNAPQTPADERLEALHINIERMETFLLSLKEQKQENLIKALVNGKEAYAIFLKDICTPDTQKRRKLLSPKVRLIQEGGVPYLVPVELAREIIAKDIWDKKIQTNQEGGQSTVVGKGGVHFKDGSSSVNGLKPPFEWAAYSFAQLLWGPGYTPATTTFCLESIPFWGLKKEYDLPNDGNETPQTEEGKAIKSRLNEKVFFAQTPLTLEKYFNLYFNDRDKLEKVSKSAYVQASLSSGKLSLLEFFQQQNKDENKHKNEKEKSKSRSHKERSQENNKENKETLSIRSFSGFTLLSLILNFTDAKDDNIRIEDNKLISIDNDHVFGNMIVTDGKGKHCVEAKNVLFLMQEEMEKPLDEFIVQKFLGLDGESFLLEWLKACAYQNEQYRSLYRTVTLPDQCEQSFIQFQPQTIFTLKERIEKIQKNLEGSSTPQKGAHTQ